MTNQTQIKWTKDMLRQNGFVSRNDALARHFTRLGAVINKINSEPDWEIKGRWTEGQKDYIYEVVKKPYIPKFAWNEERRAMVEVGKQMEIDKIW